MPEGDSDRGRPQNAAEHGFPFPQGRFGLFPVGDVTEGLDGPHDAPFGIAEGRGHGGGNWNLAIVNAAVRFVALCKESSVFALQARKVLFTLFVGFQDQVDERGLSLPVKAKGMFMVSLADHVLSRKTRRLL